MIPPTDCVSTMILPPTRCSLIVNRTAAAAVNSLFSETNEVYAPPRPRRQISDCRLIMALWKEQEGVTGLHMKEHFFFFCLTLWATRSATHSFQPVLITSRFGRSHAALVGFLNFLLFANFSACDVNGVNTRITSQTSIVI